MRSLFIANRGEIAVRIIRAARELGIETIQAFSDADQDSLAVQMADRSVNIGPPHASKSYLNIKGVVDAAMQMGADGIHPGYGFLAENAEFADAVASAGMTFVGPDGDVIRKMGDKVSARMAAIAAGVPTVPGSEGRIDDVNSANELADSIGFPVMIKAAAGGGGRGIRIVNEKSEFNSAFTQAKNEAEAAFGDGGLYIEKLIAGARHVEVQILGDGVSVVHCFERECSLQRRRQKVWEEAPAAMLAPEIQSELCESAVALAKAVNYLGAGTVEYLYDESTGKFYFIEMNTRIQVEHPISECITGIDLVAEMLRIARGEPLRYTQRDITVSGHAIEVRLNAEDPANGFMPFPGVVTELRVPGGPGVRFDSMLYTGYAIPPFYDSLLGKLIVWAESREAAITRLKRALDELRISGVKTTQPLFASLCGNQQIQQGHFHTKWLEEWLETNSDKLVECDLD